MGKKQHHIPRFILQNFTNENGLVWCLNKQTGKVFAKKPTEIGYINYLYSVGNKKNEVIEEFFSKIEANAAPIITKIIEIKRFPKSEEGRFYLFCFLTCLNLRYPALISAFNNQDNLMETAEKEAKADSALPPAERADFMNLFKDSIAEKNRFYAFILKQEMLREYRTLINKFDISLLIRQTGEFILSDEYKYFTLYPEQEGRQERRAYIFYPIAPKICIILSDKELPERENQELEHPIFSRLSETGSVE